MFCLRLPPSTTASIHLDSRHFQNSFQVVVIEELDFDDAAALMVAKHYLGAETFLDFVLHRRQMSIQPLQSGPCFFPVYAALLLLQRTDKFFGLPHIERPLQDALRREFLFLWRC